MSSTPIPQRLYWNNAGQLNAVLNDEMNALSPCPSPGLVDLDHKMELDNFQAYLADEGCMPSDITLACHLVHSHLSKDIYNDARLLEGVWKYVKDVLEYIGIQSLYAHLSEPKIQGSSFSLGGADEEDGDFSDNGNEDAGITNRNALRIRTVLRALSEQHLAMVLRFPFRRTVDRAHAENLCKIWLQMHYARRSKDYQHTRVILYDLYSNFENMFRLQDLPSIKEIPGWAMTGFADRWAGLNFKPDAPNRSPHASRSSLRSPLSPTGPDAFGSSPGRSRRGSLYLEPPKSPVSANSSYTNLFDLHAQSHSNEARRVPWFQQNNDPDITVDHNGEFPVWKTMYAYLVAGARLEYLVETKKLVIKDVLATLTNSEFVTEHWTTLTQRNALVDLAYYIFLRNRAINYSQAAVDRSVIETFNWPPESKAGLDLTVRRLKEYLTSVPVRWSQIPALSFLGHVSRSLQYCSFDSPYEISKVVRIDGSEVSADDIRRELSHLES